MKVIPPNIDHRYFGFIDVLIRFWVTVTAGNVPKNLVNTISS